MIIQGCKNSHLVEDGYCNDETNKIHCAFDGGDCCYACVNKAFCKDCLCLTGQLVEIINPLIGDGYCHDENNNAACNYDAGECCLSNINTDYCSNCSCSSNGVITSPGFPEKYANNLDLTWIIQLPRGQYIKIDFVNFDVNHDSSCR